MTEVKHKIDDQLSLELDVRDLKKEAFAEVPRVRQRLVYGVLYAELEDASGGTLWVTRHGWNLLEHLNPARWYRDRYYDRHGDYLSKGSGAVFRVTSEDSAGKAVGLVVKFSRMAQDLPLQVSSRFPDGLPRHVLDESVFNDPFQEFGLLEELRAGEFGPPDIRVPTKRPLAVYSPGKCLKSWQLGRSEYQFRQHNRLLAENQKRLPRGVPTVELSLDRQYITLFHWVRGVDAEALVDAGLISATTAAGLVTRVMGDLAAKGFRMLDIKPNHIILRRRHDGGLLTRNTQPAYALVDFELLQRTEEYRTWRETRHESTG